MSLFSVSFHFQELEYACSHYGTCTCKHKCNLQNLALEVLAQMIENQIIRMLDFFKNDFGTWYMYSLNNSKSLLKIC